MTKEKQLEQFIDRLGLRHFRGKEFTPYWTSVREGVKNAMPHESIWQNIVRTIIVLDVIRDDLGKPIRLTSTYRSPAYNAAVGGEPNSFHMRFMAIDWQCDAPMGELHSTAKDMRGRRFKLPGNGGSFVFKGGIGRYPTFIHIDCRGENADW